MKHAFRMRDFMCCMVLLSLTPWNLIRWRRMARRLFSTRISKSVVDLIGSAETSRIVIVSFGIRAIIAPLLVGSPWDSVQLLATPLFAGPRYFRQGKLSLVSRAFSAADIASATFITDSLDDKDLLDAAQAGLLIEPQGQMFRAADHLYLPLRYVASAKYSASYVLDQLLLVEMLITVISTTTTLRTFVINLLLIPLFSLSLICVYEIGYFENDAVGAKHEHSPALRDSVARFADYPIERSAWLWATALFCAGIVAAMTAGSLRLSQLPLAIVGWVSCLLLLRVLFFIYNRKSPRARIVIYPILQVLKFLPILMIFRPTPLGALLVLCQVTTMWVIYLLYRQSGNRHAIDKEAFRTALFIAGACFLLTSQPLSDAGGLFALAAIALWSLARLSKATILGWVRQSRMIGDAKGQL